MSTLLAQSSASSPSPRPAATVNPGPTPVSGGFGAVDPLKLLQKHKWLLAGAAVVGGVLGVAGHIVWMQSYPVWRSMVVFNCTPPQVGAGDSSELRMTAEEMNRFMATQAKQMVNKEVFDKVIADPQLDDKAPRWMKRFLAPDGTPNEAKALGQLRHDVSARVVAQTTLIELSVSYRDKVEATELVKLVKEKYLAVLEDRGTEGRAQRTKSLRASLDKVQADVDALNRKRDNLVKTNQVENIRSAAEATQTELRDVTEELQNVYLAIDALTKQRDQLEEEFNNPGGINYSEELIGEVDRDPLVLDIKSAISSIKSSQQAMLINGITPAHRSYVNLASELRARTATLEDTRKQLLKQRFESQLDSIKSELAQREAQTQRLLTTESELTARSNSLAIIDAVLNDIDNEIRNLQESKAETERAISQIAQLENLAGADRVIVFQRESIPTEMAFPKLAFMLPLGILLVTGAVGGGVLIRELLDQRVKGPSDITIMPRTRLAGWVPDAAEDPSGQGSVETAFRDRAKGVVAESYRQIRASLAKRLESAGHRTLLVIAGMPGSGATTTVANLALAFAAADRKVLVIDANFRRPALNRVFGLQEGPGLGDILARTHDLANAVQATSTPNVEVITAGSKSSRLLERLGAPAMSELLAAASEKYDLVLIDTAPAIVAGDGHALAHRCDSTLLVVRAFAEHRGLVARVRNELSDAKGEFLGVLVNAVRASAGGYLRGNFRATQEYHQS